MKTLPLWILIALVVSEFAWAKKDFRGLFGSYRRERFTENEGRDTDFGMDFNLSTLIPLNPLIKSRESAGGSENALANSTFFNLEASFFMSLWYKFQPYLTVGWYNYETRKQNQQNDQTNAALPLFHQFEMEAIPIILGVRYRFSREDFVPYVGFGAGYSFVRRKGFYDYDDRSVLDNSNVMTLNAVLGVEFYFASRMGIRLETSALYFNLKPVPYDTGGLAQNHPVLYLQGSTWSIRYSSGLFILF